MKTDYHHVLSRIVDRLIPIFRSDDGRRFSTDIARDMVAMVSYLERGADRCYWSCYGSGSTIRPPMKDKPGHRVPTKLDVKHKRGDDACLWFDSGTNEPIDVYEINLVTGTVTKLKHITKCGFYDEDGDVSFDERAGWQSGRVA